jgi:hypothetical protein
MPIVTKELALSIARKLNAHIKSRPNKAHDIAQVYHEGRLVAQFGIRRGSKKDLGHDHVPGDLYVRPREARLLGQCPLLREDWVEIMRQKGML